MVSLYGLEGLGLRVFKAWGLGIRGLLLGAQQGWRECTMEIDVGISAAAATGNHAPTYLFPSACLNPCQLQGLDKCQYHGPKVCAEYKVSQIDLHVIAITDPFECLCNSIVHFMFHCLFHLIFQHG